jgi:hypothetical protein
MRTLLNLFSDARPFALFARVIYAAGGRSKLEFLHAGCSALALMY